MDARSAAVGIAWGSGGLCPTSPVAGGHGNPLRVPITTSAEERHRHQPASAERRFLGCPGHRLRPRFGRLYVSVLRTEMASLATLLITWGTRLRRLIEGGRFSWTAKGISTTFFFSR